MNTKHSRYKHGLSKGRPYAIWNGIHSRCYNKKVISYPSYGAKGIKMSDSWKEDFVNFWNDMKDTYFEGAQIDRIDNSKGYSKENCRWATIKQQAQNKGNVKLYKFGDEMLTSFEIDKKLGLKAGTVRARIVNYKWSIEKALSEPKKKYIDIGIDYSKERRKWRAIAKIKGKQIFIGRYETKREAISARKQFLSTRI